MLVEGQPSRINDLAARLCRGTARAAKTSHKNKTIRKYNIETVLLSDLVVAVARLLLATDPALAAFLAASPGATLDPDVQFLDHGVTVDSGYVTTKVMLARE